MHISHQIDRLIDSLNNLKPLLSNNSSSNTEMFNDVLKASLEKSSEQDPAIIAKVTPDDNNEIEATPDWVNRDYSFDPKNPRKPNMRELMEAISGKSIEQLYATSPEIAKNKTELASNLLYGVLGNESDTRDWTKIMASNDIVGEARNQTRDLHQPTVDIESTFHSNGAIKEQFVVIKNYKNEVIKSLAGDEDIVNATLQNFGIQKGDVPNNLEEKIIVNNFNLEIFDLLEPLTEKPKSDADRLTNATLEVITNQASLSSVNSDIYIPLEDLEKL